MGRFIGLLLILILSVWAGYLIVKDPGLAFFSYRQWSVEMPLWFAILAFIVILFLFYAVWKFINSVDFFIYRLKNWLRWRSRAKSYSKTTRGLIEMIEGRLKYAEYYLLAGTAQSESSLINYLALAAVSEEQHDINKRDAYLRKAHVVAPDQDMVVGIVQAELQFKQGQIEQALATLKHLRTLRPKQRKVLQLLERVYVHMGDWKSVVELLPALWKAKVVTREEYASLEVRVYAEYLSMPVMSTLNQDELQVIWAHIPRRVRKAPDVIASYVSQLMRFAELASATEQFIRKTLKKSWNETLVKLYGLLKTGDTKKQLANAEVWIKQYPAHPTMYLTLARLCMRCQLWGKAKTYYNESLHLQSNADVYLEYGQLLEQLGDLAAAMHAYQEGLLSVKS